MRIYHFLLLFLLLNLTSYGQCPTVNFTMQDSACAGDTISIQNTSVVSGAEKFAWDFNASDLNNLPTGSMIGNYAAQVGGSLGVDYGFDNGNYYGFTLNTGGILNRFDFGNSLSNTPVLTSLGTLGGSVDFKLIHEGGNWYGFANSFGGVITRIDFGNSLANTPTAFTLNVNSSLFSTAYYMSAKKIKNNFVLMVANYIGGTITVMDLGTDISNLNPNAFNINMTSANPISVVVATDCDQIYAYVGFASTSPLAQIAFGTSINANPVVSNITLPGYSYRKTEIINDASGFSILAHTFGGDFMHQYNFGADLGNLTPSFRDLGAFNATSNGAYTFTINKTGSLTAGLITNYNSGDLTRFYFPESNTESGTVSSDFEPVLTYSDSGFHVVQLTVTDSISGASEYFIDSVYVNNLPVPGFTWQNACEGALVEFNDTTSGTGFTADWTFSSGGSQSGSTVYYQFPAAGTYDVSLLITTTAGCSKELTKQVTVYELPQVNFSFTDNECALKDIAFLDASSVSQGQIDTYSWDFGDNTFSNDTNPVHAYLTNGQYTVSHVVSANGCADTLSQTVNVIEKPDAAFTVFNTCVGETASFINGTTIPNNITLTYAWDFGNSTFSNASDPFVNYAATAANYPVTLIATAGNGCSDTSSINLRIGDKPTPAFLLSTDTACAGNPVQITNLSLAAPGENIIGYVWDFGDASTDSVNLNPSHSYSSAGTYTIQLTAISATHCDSSITAVIEVISSPSAIFTADTICQGATTTFNDISTTPAGTTIIQWDWNFGDQGSSAIADPQHLYQQAGQYTVELTVTNNSGCYASDSQLVIVKETPVANFVSAPGCSGLDVQFTDSTVSGPALNYWSWDFGNSQSSSLQDPVTQFTNSAVYPVTLIAGNIAGCFDTITKLKVIEQTPEFTISTSDNCFGNTSSFSYHPTGTPAPGLGYFWDFGDNGFDMQANTSHLYGQPGNYYSSLTVTDLNNSCALTVYDSVAVYPKPSAEFVSDSGCVNTTLDFNNLSTINGGQISNYYWNFGVYGSSLLMNPSLSATVADSFDVQLIVVSDHSCSDTVSHTAEVYPIPVSAFTASDYFGAPPLPVTFTNTSDAGSYNWDFGDNTGSTLVNPIHIFADTGLYVVTLTTTTERGCSSVYSNAVSVLNPLLDLAIENVSYVESAGYWILGSRVKNEGNVTITSFDLSAKFDGRSAFAETFSDSTLAPGQSRLITFKTRFPAAEEKTPGFLCLKVEFVNSNTDHYTSNNEKCISAMNDFAVVGIFPNPASDNLNGSYNLPESGTVSMSIFDLQGKSMYINEGMQGLKGYNNFYIPCQSFASGIYFLKIGFDGKEIIEKVMIH